MSLEDILLSTGPDWLHKRFHKVKCAFYQIMSNLMT